MGLWHLVLMCASPNSFCSVTDIHIEIFYKENSALKLTKVPNLMTFSHDQVAGTNTPKYFQSAIGLERE